MPYYEDESESHTEAYEYLRELINKYNNLEDESGDKGNIEAMISSSEDYIMECRSEEMSTILKRLNKTTPLYKILINQIYINIERLLFSDYRFNLEIQRPYEDIFDIKENLGQFDEFRDTIKELFRTRQRDVIIRIYEYAKFKDLKIFTDFIVDDYKDEVLKTLEALIYDLCNRDNNGFEKKFGKINFENIRKLGEGSYSVVYGIGDRVIKIGRDRGIWEIPDNPYIVTPIIRERIDVSEDEISPHLYVEVTKKVNPITETELTPDLEEELYEIYAKLREMGIIWADVKYENVGRLIEEQNPHFASSEFLSLDPSKLTKEIKARKKGSLVILDIDLLMTEEEFNERNKIDPAYSLKSDLAYKFYKRYEEEYGPRKYGK